MSEAYKGILDDEMEKIVATEFKLMIKPKNKIVGIAINFGIGQLVPAVDDNFADRIPEPYKAEIHDILREILVETDYKEAGEKCGDLVDRLVDIPGIDDPEEALIFRTVFTTVGALFRKKNTIKDENAITG